MGSFLKKALILRRLKVVSHHVTSDELYGLRELGDVMPRILPPVKKTHAKHFSECENENGITIVMPPVKFHVHFRKFQNLLKFSPNPNGTNGEDDKSSSASDARTERQEEIRKLQDLRQREIDHKFHQESVWRALQERDEILRRKDDKNTKNDSDKDDQ